METVSDGSSGSHWLSEATGIICEARGLWRAREVINIYARAD